MNQPAFPNTDATIPKEGDYWNYQGMTLRDYFAAQAIKAFIDKDEWHSTVSDVAEKVAFNAYAVADAMLKERKE